jgi:hypothetical protein
LPSVAPTESCIIATSSVGFRENPMERGAARRERILAKIS